MRLLACLPIASIFLLTACAPTPFVAPSAGKPLLLDVPFFPQQEGLCGPASLAAVLNYWKEPTPVEEIARVVYLPQVRGALGIDLTHFARSKGMVAGSYTGSLADLREHLIRGVPLIAFLNLGSRFFPVGHFIVITGIDEQREKVIAHSGLEANKPIPYGTFMAAWEKTNYWTLQVIPPGHS